MRSVAQKKTPNFELLNDFIKMKQTSIINEIATDVYTVLPNVKKGVA